MGLFLLAGLFVVFVVPQKKEKICAASSRRATEDAD